MRRVALIGNGGLRKVHLRARTWTALAHFGPRSRWGASAIATRDGAVAHRCDDDDRGRGRL